MNDQNSSLLQEKNIALCIVLSLVTFGIFYIVWLYGICKKIKLMAGEEPNAAESCCVIFWFHSIRCFGCTPAAKSFRSREPGAAFRWKTKASSTFCWPSLDLGWYR